MKIIPDFSPLPPPPEVAPDLPEDVLFWEKVEKVLSPYAKHASPVHPGTGTDQSVHSGTNPAAALAEKHGITYTVSRTEEPYVHGVTTPGRKRIQIGSTLPGDSFAPETRTKDGLLSHEISHLIYAVMDSESPVDFAWEAGIAIALEVDVDQVKRMTHKVQTRVKNQLGSTYATRDLHEMFAEALTVALHRENPPPLAREALDLAESWLSFGKHAAPIHPGTGTDQSVHAGVRFNYKPGSDDLKRLRHETNLQSEVDRFAGNNYQFSLTREEAENFQDEFLKWVDREDITNRSVWVRVDAGELDDIHETGQLLSLRETGFSNGSKNIKARDAWEAEALDWEKGQPSIIYGYLDKEHGFLPPDGYKGAGIPLDLYGNAAFKLKPGAAARTTWTYSDSLGTDTYPSLVTDPHIGSLDSGNWWSVWWSKRTKDSEMEYQYLEAQIHGGVKLSDIEAAYIPYGVPDSTVDKYRAAGIDTIRVPPPR